MLDKLISESVDVVRPQAGEKHVGVVLDLASLELHGDRGKLKQVLLNLLTNAVKYNRPNGDIRVACALDAEADQARISVRDTGYGISKENQKQMFQKFFRVADTAGFTQGTGLGLAITKHIVEAHGGQIWLESEEGIGTTFFVTLPMHA
jgi:signal transduction histidine kinase